MIWTSSDERLLLDLLEMDTTTPMETGRRSELADVQRRYAEQARRLGFRIAYFEPPPAQALDSPLVPLTVLDRATELGPDFLAEQPNLVLELGSGPVERTVVFNVHMDTVGGQVPVRLRDGVVSGRGAVDVKGPGVALLAGIRAALEHRPDLPDRLRVLVQAVGGEEGGAMGVYGTRVLTRLGYLGRVNVVVEPTRCGFLDRSTAAMTLRISCDGAGSTDDEPELGDNATVLLGFLADRIAHRVAPAVRSAGGKTCVAGLHTGTLHNRVYGSGQLLVNFAYAEAETAAVIEALVDEELRAATQAFTRRYADSPIAARTAERIEDVLRVRWVKRGLPTLANRDAFVEGLLTEAGFDRHGPDSALRPFTCDAIWFAEAGAHAVIAGPGDLGANNAHADGEHVHVDELDRFARQVSVLLDRCADRLGAADPVPLGSPGASGGHR